MAKPKRTYNNRHLIIILALIGGCFYLVSKSGTGPAAPQPPAWYEGGTLHRGMVAQWRSATPRNRLATSADFAAAILKPGSLEEIREPARAMMACITAATDSDSVPQNMAVSEIGASCGVLLGW